jgi:hypothetical protein
MAQGLFHYPNISQILSATFTLNHGISPSVCTIYVPPDTLVPEIGELSITYGAITITFQSCKLDRFAYEIGSDGKRRLALYILDRRWKWQQVSGGGQVSGYYNTRRNDNEVISGTEKNARELCELLFAAMGEENYNVDQVPEDQFPPVAWDYAHPAEELARLTEGLGMHVVLGLDDVVRVLPLGEGSDLPLGDDVLEPSLAIDIPETPDKLVAVAGKTRYQYDFELEAVAKDVDGEVVLLKDVSYNPNPGSDELLLADLPYWLNITDLALRANAKESFCKWYRIKEPFHLPQVVDEEDEPLDLERADILPIEAEQIDKHTIEGVDHNLPAWIYGEFYRDDSSETVNSVAAIDPDAIKPGSPGFYPGSFSIDRELGIVKFAEPVYRLAAGSFKKLPADLRLRVAVSLRDSETRAWKHHERERDFGELGTEPRYVVKPDVVLNILAADEDNLDDVNERLDYYLDALEASYQVSDAGSITYIGFKALEPDGAIRQITWSVGEDGKAYTRASRNREEVNVDVSYAERRLSEKIAAGLRDQDRRAAQGKPDADKGAPAA